MPTSDDIEKMKMELLEQQREAQEAREREQRVQDSIKLAMELQKSKVEGYYLVMGCFKEASNAENMMKSLEKMGYSAREIELKTGYAMVAIEGYATFNEALKDLELIGEKDICPYDVWIYDSKDGLHID